MTTFQQSHRGIRYTLVGLETFIVLMAIYGSIAMLVDATGFGLKQEWLGGSPFSNYQIPAVGLLVGVGGSNVLAAVLLLRARVSPGALLSIGAGTILVVFEFVEAYSIGLRSFQEPLMFVIGLLVATLAAYLWRLERPYGGVMGRITFAHRS